MLKILNPSAIRWSLTCSVIPIVRVTRKSWAIKLSPEEKSSVTFRLGRQGALYGLGISVVLGIVFLGIFAFFTTLGEAGALPPAVAVWSPSAVFAVLSVYLFLGVKT